MPTVTALLLLLACFDWGLLRGMAAQRLSSQLGRSVEIGGAYRINGPSFNPVVELERVRIGQPAWAGKGDMARIARARIRFRILPLLVGKLQLIELDLDGLQLALVHDEGKQANWNLSGKGGGGGPVLRKLHIRNATFMLDERRRKLRLDGSIQADGTGLRIVAHGRLRGRPAGLAFTGASLDARDPGMAYPFAIAFAAPTVRLSLAGKMDRALDLGHFTAQAKSSGDDIDHLDDLIQAGLPGTQPFELKALIRRDQPAWKLTGMSGRLGGSDLTGDALIDKEDGRTRITANILSQRFDFGDLSSNEGKQRAAAKRARLGPRVVPDTRINLRKLARVDGELRFRALSLKFDRPSVFRDLSAMLKLDRRLLTVSDLRVGLAHGSMTGTASVDHREGAPKLKLDLRIRDARLEDAVSDAADANGALEGRIRLRGEGDRIRSALARSNGQLLLASRDGEMRKMLAEALAQDVGRAIASKKDERTPIRCLIADFQARNGVLTPVALLIDTPVMRANGQGSISLADERVALKLSGEAKRTRLLRLAAPVEIGGTLSEPKVNVDIGKALSPNGIAKTLASVFRSAGEALGVAENDEIAPLSCGAAVDRAISRN